MSENPKRPYRYWTEEEDAVLRRGYSARWKMADLLAALPGRAPHSIYQRAHRLGIADCEWKGMSLFGKRKRSE